MPSNRIILSVLTTIESENVKPHAQRAMIYYGECLCEDYFCQMAEISKIKLLEFIISVKKRKTNELKSLRWACECCLVIQFHLHWFGLFCFSYRFDAKIALHTSVCITKAATDKSDFTRVKIAADAFHSIHTRSLARSFHLCQHHRLAGVASHQIKCKTF